MASSSSRAGAVTAAIVDLLIGDEDSFDLNVRIFDTEGLLAIALQRPLSDSEQRLLDAGAARGIVELRAELLRFKQKELAAAVERVVGATVAAVFVASHLDPHVEMISFLFSTAETGS